MADFPISNYTSVTQPVFNQNNVVYNDQTYSQNMGNVQNSINKAFLNGLDKFIGDPKLPAEIGMKVAFREPDDHNFLRYLLETNNTVASDFTKYKNFLMANNSTIPDTMKQLDLGIGEVEYIDVDNGDQFRKYVAMSEDVIKENTFMFPIPKYSLKQYRIESTNSTATAIPPQSDPNVPQKIYLDPDKTQRYSFNASASINSPYSGASAKGYQRVFLIKKRNFRPGSKTVRNVGAIVNRTINPLGDGGMSIEIQWGQDRKGAYQDQNGAWQFEKNMPVEIEPGDFLLFDGWTSTTQQVVEPEAVDYPSPKIRYVCFSTQEFTECLWQDNPTRYYGQSWNQLPIATQDQVLLAQRLRDIVIKWGNRLINSEQNYEAGRRRPVYTPGTTVPTYSEYEVTPYASNGIFPMIEDEGYLFEHYFSSAHDTSGTFKVGRIFDYFAESTKNAYGESFRKDIVLTGAVRELRQLADGMRPLGNIIPNDITTAQKMQNMTGSAFSNNDMFGNSSLPSDEKNILRFGGEAYTAINDTVISRMYGETLFATNVKSGMRFFAPDIDTIHKNRLGMNPYFPATAVRGRAVPYAYSQDFPNTYVANNNNFEMKTQSNGGFKMNLYMNVGLYMNGATLANSMKMVFGAVVANAAFDNTAPLSPTNQPEIYGGFELLKDTSNNIGTEKELRNSFTVWDNDYTSL